MSGKASIRTGPATGFALIFAALLGILSLVVTTVLLSVLLLPFRLLASLWRGSRGGGRAPKDAPPATEGVAPTGRRAKPRTAAEATPWRGEDVQEASFEEVS